MRQAPESNSLKEQMGSVIEEARMVLPGIQALFGFQTVAVFNQRFDDLPDAVQRCHLLALAMVVLAIALVMTPAAWHRIVEPHQVGEHTVRLSSRLISIALLPLAIGLALDMYVVCYLALGATGFSLGAGVAALVLLLALWFVLPLYGRAKRRHGAGIGAIR